MLSAMGGRDERAVAARAREDDVARLVADQQRARHARRRRREVDDAHAVGEVVHHPDLVVGAGRHGDGLHADRDRGRVDEAAARHVEDLERVVGRVDREELAAVGRERERPDVPALERHERGLGERAARENHRAARGG